MRTFVAEFFYSSLLMREFIIADNQDISKAGMMFLLSKQKEVSLLLEADNKAELISAATIASASGDCIGLYTVQFCRGG